MVGKLVVLITASAALIAADTSEAQARTNAVAAVSASQNSVKSHSGVKVKNLLPPNRSRANQHEA